MEGTLSRVGSLPYGMRLNMRLLHVGLAAIFFGILGKSLLETSLLTSTMPFYHLERTDLIIEVLEPVDLTMVAQPASLWAPTRVSLFVAS
jgi:hypothetical protein